MFCLPSQRVCAQSCEEDDDCPELWFCDDRASTLAQTDGQNVCMPGACSAGSGSASAEHVGDPCLPFLVPNGGFDDAQAYVEGSSTQCGSSACLVYHLSGDPREGCIPSGGGTQCATAQQIEERVYCSCRCDAPDGFTECACPNDYSCVTLIESGPAEIQGGYCVRNGSVTTPTVDLPL